MAEDDPTAEAKRGTEPLNQPRWHSGLDHEIDLHFVDQLLADLPAGCFLLNWNFQLFLANAQALVIAGLGDLPWHGKSFHELATLNPKGAPLYQLLEEFATSAWHEQKPLVHHSDLPLPTGQLANELRATPLVAKNGSPAWLLLLLGKTPDQERLMAALLKERDIHTNGPVLFFVWANEKGWPIRYASDNAATLLGIPPEQLAAGTFAFTDLVHPDDYARIERECEDFLQRRVSPFSQSYRLRRADGSYFDARDYTNIEVDDNGNILSLRGYVLDETALRRAEQQRAKSERLLERVLRASNDGWWEVDLVDNTVFYSPRWCEMLGLELEATQGNFQAFLDRVHPDDLARIQRQHEEALASTAETFETEFSIQHADGRYIRVLSRCFITRDETGTPICVSGSNLDISSQRQMERELRIQHDTLEYILEGVMSGYWEWLVGTDYTYLSPTLKATLGYADTEIPNNMEAAARLVHPEDLSRALAARDQHLASKGRTIFREELRYLHRNGSVIWMLCAGRLLEARSSTERARMVGCLIDITRRKNAEQALEIALQNAQRANEFLEAAGQIGRVGSWEVFLDGRPPAWSRATYQIHELPVGTPVTLDMAIAFYVPEDRERVQLAVQQAINKGEPFEFEAEIITATGRRIWVSTRGLPVRDAEGNVCGARGVVKDIDASRRAAEELRRRDNQFRLFSQHLPGLLYQYRIDANGHASFPFASGALDEVWGVPADQLAQDAQLLVNLVHPDDRPRLEQSISESAANLKRFTAKHRFHHPVRGLRWLQSSSSPVRQADGSIDWYGFSMDITESVLAAQAIRESDERFRFIASQVPGVVFQLRISPNGALSFPFLSAGFEQQFGIPIADFQSNHRLAAERIHPEDILRFRDAVKASAQFSLGSPLLPDRWSLDWRHLHPLKGERHLRASSAPIREADGSVLWNGYCIDETERILAAREREEMERQLQHAQKLESLGILAGGVAHDFNNLLAAIMGNLDIALEEGQELPPAIREAVSNALTITHRAADLTRQMLAYSGKGQFLVSPVNLSTLVNENAAMLRAAIHRSIRLEIQISQQDAQILGDPGQLQQIVMNLITNAAEAIERNGTIRLMVRLKNFTRDQLALNRADTELAPGVYVTLEVSDNGHGMGPETLARLFDPFFTTKFTGRGLGLSALLGIVKGHGGGILVESTPGAGTCFRVLFPPHGHPAIAVIDEPTTQAVIPLPVAEDPSSAPWALTIPIRDTPSSDAPREGILIIDDEVNILAFCRRALEKRGLNVLTASSGEDGLLLYRQQHATIATVLVDLTMPELDGIATLRLLRQVDPAPRFVLTSGYGEVAIPPRSGSAWHRRIPSKALPP